MTAVTSSGEVKPRGAAGPKMSVVIATHNRPVLLRSLLQDLAVQSIDTGSYEVLVVDDGSAEPVAPLLKGHTPSCPLRVLRQDCSGAAAARHRGILEARGEIVLILDDDMHAGPELLAEHLLAHPPGSRRAVMGVILAPPDIHRMPLFERWHQKLLEAFAENASSGRIQLRGHHLYTANLSFRRVDYLAVGGFDRTLACSEDWELGLRLEKAGVEIAFSNKAATVNGSDHKSLASWRSRGFRYGQYEGSIARKHKNIPHASPWRHLESLSPITVPIMVAPALVPPFSYLLGTVSYALACGANRLGFERLAFGATGLTRALDYFRGLEADMGGVSMLNDLLKFSRLAERACGSVVPRELVARFVAEVRADHEMALKYDGKYQHHAMLGRLGKDMVNRIGLQIMVAIRLMKLFRDAKWPLAAKVMSRCIRHVYGSDIHWDAEFEPGVVIAHGYAVGIAGGAHISSGCILNLQSTLGLGIDPVTRQIGTPHLGRNVHLGPGATVLGPITIGESSKIEANALVTQSVPPNSVVLAPRAEVRSRGGAGQPLQSEIESRTMAKAN